MNKALIVFAKAPVPGTVKTRLQADLGAEKTVAVYRSFVAEVTSQCARLKGADRFLGCAPSKDNDFLKDIAVSRGMKMFNQRGGSLGAKIFNAFRYCARKDYSEIVLIGTDSPSLPVNLIKKAFDALRKNDLVIGPCFDQGLYLIGLKKDKITRLSQNILIDTGRDVSGILETAGRLNIKLSMLPFWYDIDRIDNYNFLKLHLAHLNKTLPDI